MAVDSARTMPNIIVERMLPAASGWRATASTGLAGGNAHGDTGTHAGENRETSADGEQTVFHIVSTSKCLFVAYSMASDT